MGGRTAVFLDRDGTLIVDRHYLADPAGVELYPDAADAVARLNRAGVPVILVTNQSGIGRGYFGEPEFQGVQRRVAELLDAHGARLDGVYHCPHAPDQGCGCRKPAPGLFQRAAAEHGLCLRGSYFVGDRLRDVEPGLRLGGHALLVRTGHPEPEPLPPGVAVVDSLTRAVERVLRDPGAR